jgi:hypothetical protein
MKPFKKEQLTIKERFKIRTKLLKPFIKKYGSPVIVHSTDKKSIFKKILNEGELKLPKMHCSLKKCPYMERFLGIDNAIYYSLGFVYKTAYDWKYSLIFDLGYLKELLYYRNSVIYQCYKSVVNYWYKYDKEYLEKLANKNKTTRAVVNKYYNEEYNGKTKTLFDFWKIEKETFEHINRYKNKKKLIKIIKDTEKKFVRKYPFSKTDSKKAILNDRVPEVIGKKKNILLKNPYFLGFYIDGKIPKDIKVILNKKYHNKIIFDGRKIKIIGEIK